MNMRGFLRYLAVISGGFIVFNLLWHFAAISLELNALPTPLSVYASYERAIRGGIIAHFWASMGRACASIGISLVIGLALGLVMGYHRKTDKVLGPLLYFTYPVPKLALLPIIVLLFGIGEASKLIIIVLIIVFQITLSVRDAVKAIPQEKYALLTSLGASAGQKLWHITLPAVLPALFSALRISIGIAFSALFFTEGFGTETGLGFYITDCWMRPNYRLMYFGVLVLSLSGFFLFMLVDIADRVFCAWRKKSY